LDWVSLAAFVGIFGAFLTAFGLLLKRRAVVPSGDPRLTESLAFQNF
jgi:hypothetical protein